MPNDLTDLEVQWLEDAVGKKVEFEAEAARRGEKAEAMKSILAKLGSMTDDLAAAQDFKITWPEEKKKQLSSEAEDGKSQPWSVGNFDDEVDTRHDLIEGYYVDPKDAQRAQQMHGELIALQTKMEQMKGTDGELLFTPRDIERELWSPLVKANIIPSNAVANKYSQEALVFHGACELYAEQLTKHTKTASKHEKLKRGLSIAKDTVSLMGTGVTQAIKIANFDAVSMSRDEKTKHARLKDMKKAGTLSATQKAEFERLDEKMTGAKKAAAEQAYNTLAFGFVNGAFDLVDKSLDKPDKKRNWEIAEQAFGAFSKAAVDAVGAQATTLAAKGDATSASKTQAQAVKNLIQYSLSGAKFVFRFHEILEAPPSERKKIAQAMVNTVAEAVGSAFAAFDVEKGSGPNKTEVEGTNRQWAKIGGYINVAIKGASNVGDIAKRLHDAKESGGKVNGELLVTALGLNAVAQIMSGIHTEVSGKVRGDATTSLDSEGIPVTDKKIMRETDKQKTARVKAQAGDIKDIAGTVENLQKLFDTYPLEKIDPAKLAELEKMTADANEVREKENREAAMTEFTDKMENNADFKKKFEEDLQKETSEAQAAIMDLIAEATPSPGDLADEGNARKAMAAMDKLIAEAEACKMKWAVLDQLTAGGAAILVKFLPVAGLAVAIRKLAMDTALLVKKSVELNLWLKNKALTYGNDSVYGAAIRGRLASAKIQFSQKTVNAVFSSIGVAMESAKLADATGASTVLSIVNTLGQALSDYGYKMQKEAAVAKGWKLYKKAREPENQGDRKLAREAMKWNSTLSKCVIAYGIVVDGDPVAMEVGRKCGLTPEILQNEHDVCQKVVQYFVTIYSDDPSVLRRIPLTKEWHPGKPVVTLESWYRFKVAASTKAAPLLDTKSTDTPAIDTWLAKLGSLCDGEPGYADKRDKDFPPVDGAPRDKGYGEFLDKTFEAANGLIKSLDGYMPRNAPCPDGVEKPWSEGAPHAEMAAIADSLRAQTYALRSLIAYDREEHKVSLKDAADAKKGIDMSTLGDSEDEPEPERPKRAAPEPPSSEPEESSKSKKPSKSKKRKRS